MADNYIERREEELRSKQGGRTVLRRTPSLGTLLLRNRRCMSFDNSDPVAMLQLLEPGTESRAFIVVCSTAEESPAVDIDLGISLQSMALKAVEIGLNALILLAFDRRELLPSGPETAILT